MATATDGFPRDWLLPRVVTAGSKAVRQYATNHLRILLRAGVSNFNVWGIELLVTQLNDAELDVSNAALAILEEACNEKENLDKLIVKYVNMKTKQPSLLQKGKPGKDLLTQFLSLPNGFNLLKDISFIDSELELWKDVGLVQYVNSVEQALEKALNPQRDESGGIINDEVLLPVHFYGELAKTEEGCQLLIKQNIFENLQKTIKNNQEDSPEKTGALLAVG